MLFLMLSCYGGGSPRHLRPRSWSNMVIMVKEEVAAVGG